MPNNLPKNDDAWRQRLTPEQFAVLRDKQTEAPFSGAFVFHNKAGTYVCAACGTPLFASDTKFDAHCGWPSFYDALPGAVKFTPDTAHNMLRTEVTCTACGGHLGHVLEDAPDQPTGMRYCINSIALDFQPKNKK